MLVHIARFHGKAHVNNLSTHKIWNCWVCFFFYWLSEFLQPNRNQFLQPLNSVILMPKFLQCLFKMIFFQWIFLKTDLFSLMVLNRLIWPGVCLLKSKIGRCCRIHAHQRHSGGAGKLEKQDSKLDNAI